MSYVSSIYCVLTSAFHVDLDIVANRLFGPQPHTSTYVCVWDIKAGKIQGSITMKEARLLSAVVLSFKLGYIDAFNAPAQEFIVEVDRDGECTAGLTN